MLDILAARRSIRKYGPDPVPDEVIERLEEAALRAPSSRNLRPWRFVFVTDPDVLSALSTAKPQWAGFIAGAPLGVVVCGDEHASDCWIEDCSIAATAVQLTATSEGLGSCWIQIRERMHADGRPAEEYVRELLGLTSNMRVLCMLAIGHPAEEKPMHATADLAWDRVESRAAAR
jgi:nitroreductase